MKRVVTFLLALLLILSGTSAWAESAAARGGANLPYDRIIAMAQYVRELALGDYLDIKQVPENMQTIAQGWAAGIEGEPRLAVQVDINGLASMVETRAAFAADPPIVSFEAQSNVISEAWQILVSYASGDAGLTDAGYEEIVDVNSHLNARMIYAEEGVEGNAMYIVLYDNAAPILYIVNAENGAVSVSGLFLPSQKLARCQNYGQVALWLMLAGLPMTCREIKAE